MNRRDRCAGLFVVCLIAAACAQSPQPTSDVTPIEEATAVPTPTIPASEPGSISIESVQVAPGRITFSGASTPPDGICVLTQLEADGLPQTWWPATDCSELGDGAWRMEVALGRQGAPEALDPVVAYVLRAWQREDPGVEAALPFDLAGPPSPEVTTTYISRQYGVMLEHPAGWEPVEGYDERIGGEEGFLQLNALVGQGWDVDKACRSEAYHKLMPYGSSPRLQMMPGLAGDGCLILPSDDQPADLMGQAALVVPYPEPVRIGGATYNYLLLYGDQVNLRAIAQSLRFLLSPGLAEQEPVLTWHGQADDGTCRQLSLWHGGLASTGDCERPLQPVPYFGHRGFLTLWPEWRERFAPFEADTPSGRVVFRGRGRQPATGDWQRALSSWASLACRELQYGRSGASWGTAMAGHWQTSPDSELCQFLQVETYGYAYTSLARCGGGAAHDLGRGWLEPAEWERFDQWLYGQSALSTAALDFFGAGEQEMTCEQGDALATWAEQVYSRLSGGVPVPLAASALRAWSGASPDGLWTARGLMIGPFMVGEDEQYRRRLVVSRLDDSISWTIVDETSHYGLGYTVPSPFHWSRDGLHLYFTNLPVPDGCALFVNGSDLQRLNLDDGSVVAVLDGGASWLSLSPDEATLAYTHWDGQALALTLQDMAGGDERHVAFGPRFSQGGSIVWSPEGTALALTLAADPCDPNRWEHAIVLVQAADLQQTTLLAEDRWLRQTVEWREPGRLELVDREGRTGWLDLESGQIAQQPSGRMPSLEGLVFSTDDGLSRLDGRGSPELLVPEPHALVSPDGRRAILATEQEIETLDLTSGERRVLRSPPGYNVFGQPRWANNDRILYGSYKEGSDPGPGVGHLTAAAADGSWVQLLDIESTSNALPAASPDGELVAYDRAGTAWIRPWLGDAQALDAADFGLSEPKDLRIGSPAWSPDGRRIVWVAGGSFEGDWRIGLAVFDLEARTGQLLHLYEPLGVGGWPDAPVWSPDGQWLAYVVWPVADPAVGGLWVMRPNGEAEWRLGPGNAPVWSPDGRWLVYTEQLSAGETAVWLVEAGIWQPQLLDLPAGALVQAWTPGT